MSMAMPPLRELSVGALGRQLAELRRRSIHAVWREARRKFGARSVHSIDPGTLGEWLHEQVDLVLAERERERQQAAEVFRHIEQLSDASDEPITPPVDSDGKEEA